MCIILFATTEAQFIWNKFLITTFNYRMRWNQIRFKKAIVLERLQQWNSVIPHFYNGNWGVTQIKVFQNDVSINMKLKTNKNSCFTKRFEEKCWMWKQWLPQVLLQFSHLSRQPSNTNYLIAFLWKVLQVVDMCKHLRCTAALLLPTLPNWQISSFWIKY